MVMVALQSFLRRKYLLLIRGIKSLAIRGTGVRLPVLNPCFSVRTPGPARAPGWLALHSSCGDVSAEAVLIFK